MSVRISTWVWHESEAAGTDLLVLLALADIADDDGICWPSVATLATKTRLSRRTVQRSLTELSGAGVLRREKQVGTSNRYVILTQGARHSGAGDRLTHASQVAQGVRHGYDAGGASLVSPNTSMNHQLPVTSEVAAAPPRQDVVALCELLADLIEANGSKRPTIGKRWIEAARLMLDRDGRTPQEAERIIRWSQNDEFWRTNILSMPKFREKYDQLKIKAGANVVHPKASGWWDQ